MNKFSWIFIMENQSNALTQVLYIEQDGGNLDFFGFEFQPIEKKLN